MRNCRARAFIAYIAEVCEEGTELTQILVAEIIIENFNDTPNEQDGVPTESLKMQS